MSDSQTPQQEPTQPDPIEETRFTLARPQSSKLPEKYEGELISLPGALTSDVAQHLEDLPRASLSGTPEQAEWATTLQNTGSKVPLGDSLQNVLEREGAEFTQEVKVGERIFRSGFPPRIKSTGRGGEQAIMDTLSTIGMGGRYSIALWHSGFHIRIKTPSDGAILNLLDGMADDKVKLGRSTYGLIHSNQTSYTNRRLVEFIADHLYDSSLILEEDDNLMDYIVPEDIPILIKGLAACYWPRGYAFKRACTANPLDCHHVSTELLNISELELIDISHLTEAQSAHMAKVMTRSMSKDSVKEYRSQFLTSEGRDIKVTVNNGRDDVEICFHLKTPSLTRYFEAGFAWINALEETHNRALTQSPEVRADRIASQAKATAMRQYAHYVETITVGDKTHDTLDIVNSLLDRLSSNREIRTAFVEGVLKYISDSTVALIAMKSYECPKCGGAQRIKKPGVRFSDLIALDAHSLFFTPAAQRRQRIEQD